MPGVRQAAQFVNGRWWFLKNPTTGGSTGKPVNGRWWFLRSNSSQAFSSAESNSRYTIKSNLGLSKQFITNKII